ncbi:hypothetical protein N0V90_006064 [Kalmusia sp. IMI 367209]|nr:hypothetical protein N0V90_006064 [Kalmusia sp. IMI 367209]
MAGADLSREVPIPEQTLRDLSKDIIKNPILASNPLLQTAASPDITSSQRAAACNVICAIIERAQTLGLQHIQQAILDDSIWSRSFTIYLEKSDSAKGKSVRQVLVTLTNVLLRNQTQRAFELQDQAVAAFVDIICQRQDRIKVKPALQGLAHFLQKDITTIPKLVEVYSKSLEHTSVSLTDELGVQSLFTAFLSWIVHHDTSLSAGHLIKSFLNQLRRIRHQDTSTVYESVSSVWMKPVVDCLHQWPDRIQEFKTHVFPHCFLPNVDEYVQFLSYLHFPRHVASRDSIPQELSAHTTKENGLEDFEEFRILLASVQTAKELGIIKDVDYRLCKTVLVEHEAILLPDDIFGGWLSHMEGEVRLAGLFLSVYSTNVTRIITGGIFRSLKKNLLHLHNDTDVNFRRELIGYIQRLFNRLRGSTATLAKSKHKAVAACESRLAFPDRQRIHQHKSTIQDPLEESLHFITWYITFLEGELRSDASYQRRITALRALMVVLKSGVDSRVPHHLLSKGAQGQLNWAHGLQVTNTSLIRKVLDMTLDPFDDIRDTSISILQVCFEAMPDEEREVALSMLKPFINRAEATMLRTGRADQADGLARSYALYYSCLSAASEGHQPANSAVETRNEVIHRLTGQLEETLTIARNDLSDAVNGRPVHGIFAAIRYIIDQDEFYGNVKGINAGSFNELKQIQDQLINECDTVWSCVRDVLCVDAPEGHVPEDLEEEASLDTKEILSYSWRALKEASTLLRVMATRAPIGSQDRDVITATRFEELGRLCFTQLIELRHRGAFSAVAQTFAAFCRRCYTSDDDVLRGLPEKWYQETLFSIQAQAHAITRRSGGIPALMAGIVSAEPQPGGKLLPQAIRDLIVEATVEAKSSNIEESRLPQVHALNCIKEFFMTSKLSVSSEAYIGDSLELAARMLNSKIWPIRNCGLMLFKALIERLLGSDEVQDWKERAMTRTSRFSYHNYPSLVGMLDDLLNPEGPLRKSLDTPDNNSPMDLHGAEGVFPALQILRQAMPPEDSRMSIIQSVMRLLSSPHWHLRDMAARTITALYRPHELLTSAKWLLDNFEDFKNANHGKLLCIKYCIRKGLQNSDKEQEFLGDFMVHLSISTTEWYTQSNCSYVKAAFLDLVSVCGMSIIEDPVHEATMSGWAALTSAIGIGPEQAFDLSRTGVDALFQRSLAEVFFIDRAILRPECIDIIVSDKYQSIESALMELATEAPDTCTAGLDVLHQITQLKTPRGHVLEISLILLQIYRLVRDAQDTEVLSKAQAVLADGLTRDVIVQDVLTLIHKPDMLSTLDKLEEQCLKSAPSNAQSALHLLGLFLDWTYNKYPAHRRTTLQRIARYIRVLRMTILDTNPFDARFAAVNSICALKHIWTMSASSKTTAPLLLGLSLVLYDLLNDDDDEIRDVAALATTSLLQAHSTSSITPSVPMLTSHRLAAFLVQHFSTSSALAKEALRRLTDTPVRAPLFSTPFAQSFALARKEDTTLFATEKQNLYMDPTLDAIFWSRVLGSLPVSSISETLRRSLVAWVEEALGALTETAKTERDGALGWASKSEVFTLGMRVVCAADVVLKWEGQAGVSAEGRRVRTLLAEFKEVGTRSGAHGLWMGKVDSVLEGSVVGVVRNVVARMLAARNVLGRKGEEA